MGSVSGLDIMEYRNCTRREIEYLAGDVYCQPFGSITTTESRLVPHGHNRVMWDNKKYEEQLFYFNTVTRVARYAHSMPVGKPGYGLDYCYDCRSEVKILSQYLRKYNPELQGVHLKDKFCVMTCRCSQECAFFFLSPLFLGVSGATIVSGSCDRPSHSWISRLLTSSLSLGISSLFCRSTQCM